MPEKKGSNQRNTGVTEIKVLITAGAMAATVAGWAALALQSERAAAEEPVVAPPPELPAAYSFLNEPLPTLVAPAVLPGQAPAADVANPSLRAVDAPPPVKIVTITRSSSSSGSSGSSGRTRSS
jgi:hypothetical protein